MGITDLPIPPNELRFMTENEQRFVEDGDRLVSRLDQLSPLAQTPTILDVGSGYGRVAHALLRRDDFSGRYLGFDILARHVAWCESNLAPASDGRFRFVHLDVKNERYNPKGGQAPEQAQFPVGDGWSGLTILTSVFTHMYPAAIQRYLREIERTLSPAGRAFVTAFVLDEALLQADGRAAEIMPYELDSYCRYVDPKDPLYRIGYDHRWLSEAANAAGLRLQILENGTWRRNAAARGTQDSMMLTAAPAA